MFYRLCLVLFSLSFLMTTLRLKNLYINVCVLSNVQRNQGIYGSVGLAPRILDLGTVFPLC